MQQRQKQKKAEAKIEDLAVQLARIASETVTKNNVRDLIAVAGHTVTRQNAETISVLHPGRKKARRYSLPKLLEDIEQAQSLSKKLAATEPVKTEAIAPDQTTEPTMTR